MKSRYSGVENTEITTPVIGSHFPGELVYQRGESIVFMRAKAWLSMFPEPFGDLIVAKIIIFVWGDASWSKFKWSPRL